MIKGTPILTRGGATTAAGTITAGQNIDGAITVNDNNRGAIEASNGALKRQLKQELLLRGSRDFESVEAYERWLWAALGEEVAAVDLKPHHFVYSHSLQYIYITSSL